MTASRATEPPRDVPAERLFRLLLARHPSRPLARPVAGLSLDVRPITAAAEAEAVDLAGEEVEELRESRLQREILSRVLWLAGRPAFLSPDEVGLLDGAALAAVLADVGEALAIIAPTYARSNVDAWSRALERGAMHLSNVSATVALASCVDVTPAGGITPRPDRYWGCPVGELLDGHWMVWRAARAAVERVRAEKR